MREGTCIKAIDVCTDLYIVLFISLFIYLFIYSLAHCQVGQVGLSREKGLDIGRHPLHHISCQYVIHCQSRSHPFLVNYN